MLVISILVINIYFHRPVLGFISFFFSISYWINTTIITSDNKRQSCSWGKADGAEKVIVKRLASIENLGSINILCSDKTGTLTVGEVKLHSAINIEGNKSEKGLTLCLSQCFLRDRF